MLQTISEIIQAIISIIPRIIIVTKQEQGIKFLPRGKIKILNPKTRWFWPMHWYWPITTKIEVVPIVRQPLDLPVQTLMTKDKVSVIAGGIIFYSIQDITKYLVLNYDSISGIQDAGAAALREVLVDKTLEEIQSNSRKTIDNALIKSTRDAFEAFGVHVHSIRLKDFSTARILNIVTAQSLLSSLKEQTA